tara:strand:+ start:9525 stop:10262 length:738 start_codon:yes stop_codon:yes gene_type:complete
MCKDEFKSVQTIIKAVESVVSEVVIVITGNKQVKQSGRYKVLYFPWFDDYSAPLNAGLRLVESDWIFRMDTDEEIDSENLEKISRAVKMEGIDAFQIHQRGYLPVGREEFGVKKVEEYKGFTNAVDDGCIRLFRNDPRIFFEFNTHETLYNSLSRAKLKYIKTDLVIHHWGKLNMKVKAPYYYKLAKDRLRRFPDDYQSYYYLGVSAEFIGKLEEAYEAFKAGYDKYGTEYYRIPMDFLNNKRRK